jgi:hypothetical protein
MAYDVELADRVREIVAREAGLSEKRMFGGLAFLVGGRMAVAASNAGGLLLRVDPRRTDELLAVPGVARFVMRGREMDGWLRVDAEVVATDEALREWVAHGVAYAGSLPPAATAALSAGRAASGRAGTHRRPRSSRRPL